MCVTYPLCVRAVIVLVSGKSSQEVQFDLVDSDGALSRVLLEDCVVPPLFLRTNEHSFSHLTQAHTHTHTYIIEA